MSIENKVRVTKLFGGGAALGVMSPQLGMTTHKGSIVEILSSGTYQVAVSGEGVGAMTRFYPHELFVHYDHATGVFSWPTGDGSVVFGRPSSWLTDGVPDALGSGMYYSDGDGPPIEFSR